MHKKRELTDLEKAECASLKRIYSAKKKKLGLSQYTVGDKLDITQAAVSNYLNGRIALNVRVAIKFANVLKTEISDFSQRLHDDAVVRSSNEDAISRLKEAVDGLSETQIQELIEQAMIKKRLYGESKED